MNGTGSPQEYSPNGRKDSKGLPRTDFNDPRIRKYENNNGMNGVGSGGSLRGVRGQKSLQGSGVRKSLVSVGLDSQHNPYSAYDFGDGLDDGIHTDLTASHHGESNGVDATSDQRPSEDVVLREFSDYMEVMSPMSEPEEVALKNTNTEEKWRLICNQRQRSPIFAIRHYIENLRQNQGTRRKKFPSLGKSTKGSSSLSYLLKKLKIDLKMSPLSFLEEFSEPPNGGGHLLVQLLRTLQTDQNAINTSRASRMEEFKKILEDEADCLLALKYLARSGEGLQKLARQEGVFDLILQSTLSTKSKCRAAALQLLSLLCGTSNSGYHQLMAALGRQRQKLGDQALFTTLCTSINSADVNNDLQFIVAAVHLFNTLVISTASNANASVYLQYELERAGFNPDHLEKYSYGNTVDHEDLCSELERWRRQYVDVRATREAVTGVESRNQMLRAEVTRLQEQLKTVEKSTRQIEREKRKMSEKRDDYRERAAELQDTVAKLTKLYSENTGKDPDQVVNVDEVLKPLDTPPADIYATVRSVSSVTSDVPKAPPLPPPAPPMIPPKRKMTSSTVELPMLNWTPIHTVTNTIFQDLDDERVYKEIDFTDFESRFKLQRRPETAEMKERRQRMARRQQADKLYFVNPNRAKNICITKHRTGLTARQIREAVEQCDVTTLPGEYAELFIKFVPTKEELKLLAKHREEYWNMGEAEQFLFQLAQVERLESRLSLLAFVGVFDELLASVKPNITHVLDASNYVQHNEGLKRIFEIILAFGNYMNGAKRGYTMGFRLESLYKLSDVKTVDKQQTLLHYLAEQVHANYPELLSLLDDTKLRVPKGASYHAMLNDVKGLRKGLDLVNFEKEKQPHNTVLERFYSSASLEVAGVAESFKKMEEAYKEVCLSLGENYKQIEPDNLFGILADFAADFKKAHHQNLKRRSRPLSSCSSRSSLTPSDLSLTSSTITTPGSNRRDPDPSSTQPPTPSPPPAPTPAQTKFPVPAPPQAPSPAKPLKKEAPKILAPLTPQQSPRTRVIGQSNRKEPLKGGSVGPMAAQHDVGVAVVTSAQKDMTSSRERSGSVKRMAPAPPPAPAMTVVNGPEKMSNGVAPDNEMAKDDVKKRPLSLEIPERPRTFSEPSTADVMNAINTLDQIVDYEERFGGLPEEETFTSYL